MNTTVPTLSDDQVQELKNIVHLAIALAWVHQSDNDELGVVANQLLYRTGQIESGGDHWDRIMEEGRKIARSIKDGTIPEFTRHHWLVMGDVAIPAERQRMWNPFCAPRP